MIRRILVAVILLAFFRAAPVFAQQGPSTSDADPQQPGAAQGTAPPAIRRWLDVQQVSLASRFRWYENSAGRVTSSTLQWQSQLRGRFLFDEQARYSLTAHASTGATFPSSWNNTGVGLGPVTRPFNVKQLFLAAEPVKGLEFQAGGLFINRGEMVENITYDNDTYIVGERVTVRPAKGRITQIAVTAGFFGDFRETSVFKRLDGMSEYNYGQALIGFRVGPRAVASAEYTHEDGRHILRQGIVVGMPPATKVLTSIRLEAYERVSGDEAAGFNVSADLRWRRLLVTGGVMSVDQFYGPFNGDRYETGRRWYSIGTFTVTQDLTVGWFQTEAFGTSFPIPLKHRFDIIASFNPTATLRRAGLF